MTRRIRRLLHDWVLIKLDPIPAINASTGGIVLVTPRLVRTGIVTMTGPGKRRADRPTVVLPLSVSVGNRVALLAGNMDTKGGRKLQQYVQDDEALVPESAVLFIIDGDLIPEVTL